MLNIFFYIIVLLLCLYVIKPLLGHNDKTITRSNKKAARLEDFIFKQELLKNTMQELNFDHQMGKISDDDFKMIEQEHQESLTRLEKQIQHFSGISMDKIQKKLEQEIALKKQNLNKKK